MLGLKLDHASKRGPWRKGIDLVFIHIIPFNIFVMNMNVSS